MHVVLLAVSPGGESYWFANDRGDVFRDDRYAPGPPVLVGANRADLALLEQGAERLNEPFDSWGLLMARVEELVPRRRIRADDIPVTLALAHKAPRLLTPWIADGRVEMIPAVVGRLLAHDEVSRDPELVRRLSKLLLRAQSPPSTPGTGSGSRFETFNSYFAAESRAA